MVTSQFLHAGSMHLLCNMVVLLFLGKNVEERIGSLKFLVFYLASGIAGNIVYAVFHLSSPFSRTRIGCERCCRGCTGCISFVQSEWDCVASRLSHFSEGLDVGALLVYF